MLPSLYPACWHLVYKADELARSSHSNRAEERGCEWTTSRGNRQRRRGTTEVLWDWNNGELVSDTEFWHTQEHGPALACMAMLVQKEVQRLQRHMVAVDYYLQGGLDATSRAIEPLKPGTSRTSRSRNRTKTRMEARKKKAADFKAFSWPHTGRRTSGTTIKGPNTQ